MVRPLSESTSAIKIALVILLITFLIFVVGFSTPNWTVITESGYGIVSYGLWRQCVEVWDFGTECVNIPIGYG